jgi:serine/threonine protein kinase
MGGMVANGKVKGSLLKARQRLGKYRIERRIDSGAFAAVYQAFDTIEGIRVALKIPHHHLTDEQFLEDFRKEVRVTAKLDHENILSLKDASFIDGHFVIAMPLGVETLFDRLQRRMSLRKVLNYSEQALSAAAYAHSQRIIHCDIKPENFILFSDDRLCLADFGIAKMSLRTMEASGAGTIGYIAPEQAMGHPSCRSDVFSLGLILYRMLTGHLPRWPYEWPPPRYERMKGHKHPDLIDLVRKAISVNPKKRFNDAGQMLVEFRRLKARALRKTAKQRRTRIETATRDWQEIRLRQFKRRFGKALCANHECRRCGGPVSESMIACPWCGNSRKIHRAGTRFPAHCPTCNRGVKLDWKHCPWCHGPGFKDAHKKTYSDDLYEAVRCDGAKCSGRLMRFMKFCPWCRKKVKREWKIPNSKDRCPSCNWGVLSTYWSYCPWCGESLVKK